MLKIISSKYKLFNLIVCVFLLCMSVNSVYANGVRELEKQALEGSANAQNKLGIHYYEQRNYNVAEKWFRKAAAQNNDAGQYYIGVLYHFGHGVKKDDCIAKKWFHKSAIQGNIDAQYNLGSFNYAGRCGNKDYSEAAKWFRKVAEKAGGALGRKALQSMEEDGLIKKCLPWMDLANNLQEAQYHMYASLLNVSNKEKLRIGYLLGAEPWTAYLETNKIGIPLAVQSGKEAWSKKHLDNLARFLEILRKVPRCR